VLAAALGRAGLRAEPIEEGHLRVREVSAGEVGRIAFAAGVALDELTVEEASLEDAFLALTNGAPTDGAGKDGER